jgi:hypothetical protein
MKNLSWILLLFILSLFSCHDDIVLPKDMNFIVNEEYWWQKRPGPEHGQEIYGPYNLSVKYISTDSILLSIVDPQYPIDHTRFKAKTINRNDSILFSDFARGY